MPQSLVFSIEVINDMLGVEMCFSCKIDSKIIIESRVLNTLYIVSIMILSRKLLVVREIKKLNNQITNMSQIIADKDKNNKILKQENKELKRLINKYTHDLQSQVDELEREKIQIQD